MYITMRRRGLFAVMAVLFVATSFLYAYQGNDVRRVNAAQGNSFIKWVEFHVPYEALDYAMKQDIKSHTEGDGSVSWIPLLACQAAKTGGKFSGYKNSQLEEILKKRKDGQTMEELTKDLKYYSYYLEAYTAVLGGLLGEYEIEVKDSAAPEGKKWEKRYGLKAFSPIAKNYYYTESDDFGNNRSYGYKRPHLGHDMMGSVGTPIIAVESGTVEELGWNQYGGWRIGIRSLDQKRYYYYAHFRQNFPYPKQLKKGDKVLAGDVIGYMGRTGYSTKENVNNITEYHLHFGLQLIFDESQKEGNNEIWVDVYPLVRLLSKNRSAVVKDNETKEYSRVYQIKDPAAGA